MNQLVIDGVSVRQDFNGRFCLNDLHRAAGNENRHKPGYFLNNEQTKMLISELLFSGGNPASIENQPVMVVNGGYERGSYACKELIYAYAMWISPSFSLKVIRTFDAVVQQRAQAQLSDKVQAGTILLESMAKTLNLSNSSKLGGYQKLQQMAGLPNLSPSYAIDAPSDAVDGSSRSTHSLTEFIRKNGLNISAQAAYKRLSELGLVERKTRPSTKGVDKTKHYWSITSKGLIYGKNMTSPNNPRETQPHFYESKSADLVKLMVVGQAV
ncbi:KilA-N domain-containing protein [Moellerella wisconsensis]|uniref:KilA-N domain-containing protein n=1 Tax=Moellerella wisconsensis TaxID=158849 RepID=UPI001F4EC221|nr:KilA-N domain-containing protein [Moellerella wisconsensis]UNH23122.1 KilA-N domain-containing protein [Moellerella wisconsensis]